MIEALLEQMVAAVTSATGKEPDELSELEKVALAYCAGLPYRTTWTEEGKLRVDIVNPFGIQKIDGKFTVVHREPFKGDRVSFQPEASHE